MSRNLTICVEGAHNVECLLESSNFETLRVFLEEGRHDVLHKKVLDRGIPLQVLSAEMMAGAAGYQFHRGVFAHAKRPDAACLDPTKVSRLVVLTHLADEGNLGTIIRTATAFGADGILLEKNKGGDPYSRKAIRASSRGIFKLPVFESSDVPATLRELKTSGFEIFGTSPHGESISVSDCAMSEKMAVVFGAEKDGVPEAILKECTVRTSIPMERGMDSLNVAGCAAVVLYELFSKKS